MIESCLDIYVDPQVDDTTRQMALTTLEHLAQANPDAVTPKAIRKLTALMFDASGQYVSSSDTMKVLVSLARTTPQAFKNEAIQPLLAILDDSQSRSYEKVDVGHLLAVLAPANSDLVTQERIQTFADAAAYQPQLVNPDLLQLVITSMTRIQDDLFAYSVEDTGNSLAKLVQANPEAATPELIQSIHQLIQDNNLNMRSAGIYAAFYITLGAPSKTDALREDLLQLRNDSPLPHARSAASKALELMAISDWIQEARLDRQRAPSIMLKLFLLSKSSLYGSHLRPGLLVGMQEVRR